MPATIELDDLQVQLGGRTILDGLRGALNGRAIGLLGPNGAGKSTLINTLLGFYQPARGTAKVLGMDIRQEARRLRGLVGYMPESDSFISDMTGIRFVRYMAEISGLPAEQAMERAHEAFFYVGLGEVRYRKLGTYSLGMKQLAKLAQAIAHGPKLLIMDEPTNGLDPPARQRMIQLVREIRDASDMRLIISSHLLRDVEETCEEVLILRNGRVAALQPGRRAPRKSQIPRTRDYRSERPIQFGVAATRLRVRCLQQWAHESGDAGQDRDPRGLSHCRRARNPDTQDESPARFAGRHFPERNGTDRSGPWRSINAHTARTTEP